MNRPYFPRMVITNLFQNGRKQWPMVDHFVELAFKGLGWYIQDPVKRDNDLHGNCFELIPNYAVNFLHLTIDAICFRSKCKMQNMRPLIERVTSLSEYRHTLF